jgi:glycosyltransferase involved in cell wall biosynthesis
VTRPRILHLTRDYPPQHSGGLSTAVAGMVMAQQQAGCDCVVVSFDDFRPREGEHRNEEARVSESLHGTTILRVHEKIRLESALAQIAKLDSKVVHVHHESLWDFAREVMAQLGVPSVFSAHTLQSEQDRLRGGVPTRSTEAQGKALQGADLIHAPSQALADLLSSSVPGLGPKIRTIPLASEPWPEAKCDVKRDQGSPLLLYVGRFADINGFAQFLEALPTLFENVSNLRAVAAGGLPGNARGANRWKNRWSKMAGVHESRLAMPGWLGREELSALYSRATLLVIPSWFETFGQVALEGMLHGTPILTTGAGALAELVDESSALLIEAKSASAIVSGVTEALDRPTEARARALCAQRKVSEGYLWSSRMPAFLSLYRELCD